MPSLIESAGKLAGMPVGPLAVTDEVSLELQYKVENQTRADLGAKYKERVSWPVLKHFVEDLKRVGRKGGAGFYDYPAGGKKVLWEGLRREYPQLEKQPAVEELKTRLLYIQALETARCFEEGVLRSAHEADLGSILGWGFPAYTGGTLSFIDTVGPARFVAECKRLAKLYGERFKPTKGLLARAQTGEGFYASAAKDTQRHPHNERSPPRTARSRRDRHAESSRVAERLHERPATGLEKGTGGGRQRCGDPRRGADGRRSWLQCRRRIESRRVDRWCRGRAPAQRRIRRVAALDRIDRQTRDRGRERLRDRHRWLVRAGLRPGRDGRERLLPGAVRQARPRARRRHDLVSCRARWDTVARSNWPSAASASRPRAVSSGAS